MKAWGSSPFRPIFQGKTGSSQELPKAHRTEANTSAPCSLGGWVPGLGLPAFFPATLHHVLLCFSCLPLGTRTEKGEETFAVLLSSPKSPTCPALPRLRSRRACSPLGPPGTSSALMAAILSVPVPWCVTAICSLQS